MKAGIQPVFGSTEPEPVRSSVLDLTRQYLEGEVHRVLPRSVVPPSMRQPLVRRLRLDALTDCRKAGFVPGACVVRAIDYLKYQGTVPMEQWGIMEYALDPVEGNAGWRPIRVSWFDGVSADSSHFRESLRLMDEDNT